MLTTVKYLLRGCIVIGTRHGPNNHVSLFLRNKLGADYFVNHFNYVTASISTESFSGFKLAVSMAISTVNMELHTSCESDVKFGKQQSQWHMLLCVACDYC